MFELDPERTVVDMTLCRVREFVIRKNDAEALRELSSAIDTWMNKDFPSRPGRLILLLSAFHESLPDDRMSRDFLSGVLKITDPWKADPVCVQLHERVHSALAARPAAA